MRAVVVAIMFVVSPARSEPTAAQAEALFREGRDLLAAGKLADARVAFAQSYKLDPAVTTLLNLAGCEERLGKLATAWGLFLDAERQTRDDAQQQLHAVAHDHAVKLEPRVPKLAINVPLQSQLGGLEIMRGTERIDPVMWNRVLPIDGGTYAITARAPGANPWTTEVTIAAEGDVKAVDIPDLRNLPRDLVPKSRDPEPAPREVEPTPAPPPRRLAPLVVGAGAVVLIGGALGFDLLGDSTYAAAQAERTTQTRRDSLFDSANQQRYVAEGLAIAGVAAAGTAVWLYLHHDTPATTTSARLVVSPSGFAIAGGF